ncbi:hypothetical protein H6F50_09690 [Coleofasciculus sp. FACHB-712]|uniref:hypothetical protein n=1 Tax=Cyanophyceae TaxID=3028117 RepID=UPI001687A49E|nr:MULTISPECIES: hypothetical protein [unclassified Coleofasciculus]MBD1890302.1 hypothetical protein [Coleofasciculus sp. FACHB-SPT9]MBD1899629.1 hypothetical protein [Coleofasciculus sp. FACHB-125]MBD1942624.1 hypothetical protein [Coleofasciculus sp. FACHB-712]MBD2542021.1 hypothetical protein [Coleofasciculus sp. FACHB-SPT36]
MTRLSLEINRADLRSHEDGSLFLLDGAEWLGCGGMEERSLFSRNNNPHRMNDSGKIT